jgi:hypothetical protein
MSVVSDFSVENVVLATKIDLLREVQVALAQKAALG